MRNVALTLPRIAAAPLLVLLTVPLLARQSTPGKPQVAKGQGAAKASSQAPPPKPPETTKPKTPSSCQVGRFTLHSRTDGPSIAKFLVKLLPDVAVSPDPKQSSVLDAFDVNSDPAHCKSGDDTSQKALVARISSALKALDRDDFPAATFDPAYLIEMKNLKAGSVVDALPYPTPFLQLREIGEHFLLPVPMQGGRTKSLGDDALRTEALKVKHDLEAVDTQYAGVKSAQPPTAATADLKWAIWVSQHTIPLSALAPRDLVLAFHDEFDAASYQLLPLVPQHAVEILPKTISVAARSTTEGLERNLLQQNEDRAQRESGASGSSASKGAPPADPATEEDPDPADSSAKAPDPPTGSQNTGSRPAKAGAKPAPPAKTNASAGAPPAASTPVTDASKDSGAKNKAPTPGAAAQNSQDAKANAAKADDQTKQAQAAPPAQASDDKKSPSTDPKGGAGGSGPGRVVRLYHMRKAADIAAVINQIDTSAALVTALGDDQIVILPSGQADRTEHIRRMIAMLDLPRPQISLQVWSYQISTDEKNKANEAKVAPILQKRFEEFRGKVASANDELAKALARGMGAVEYRARPSEYFDKTFREYLTFTYDKCVQKDQYCLGYSSALGVPKGAAQQPSSSLSLDRFLLLLAAADDAKIGDTVGAMETAMRTGAPAELTFSHFFPQLEFLAAPANLHASRAAVLDFFYQYKMALSYPKDFSPYELQQTAHRLDNLLNPLMDAFNRDVDDYIERALKPPARSNGIASELLGEVQVTTISGTQGQVTGKVVNYFDVTQQPSLTDILNNSSGTASSALSTALKDVLTPKEISIVGLIANANTQPKVYAQLSKDASLTITPTSLDDASAAELDVQYDVKDDSDPATVNQSSNQADLLDRVAEHQITDHVRVESLKLFDISTFSMQLTHKSQPKCWVYSPFCVAWKAVFGSVPKLDTLFDVTPHPQVKDNRSAAVVRAVVVPTSMDLGLSVPFESDYILDPATKLAIRPQRLEELNGDVSLFHKKLIRCMLEADSSAAWSCAAPLKLSDAL